MTVDTSLPPPPATARELPILPISYSVVLPRSAATVMISQPLAQAALEVGLQPGATVVAIGLRDASAPVEASLYRVGTEAQVISVTRLDNGSANVVLLGLWRVSVADLALRNSVLYGLTTVTEPLPLINPNVHERETIINLLTDLARLTHPMSFRMIEVVRAMTDIGLLCDFVAATLPLNVNRQQAVLEAIEYGARLDVVIRSIKMEIAMAKTFRGDPTDEDGGRRLGLSSDADRLREHFEGIAGLPEEVTERVEEELAHLEALGEYSQEYGAVHSYLRWLSQLPWESKDIDDYDLEIASNILDLFHYGLRKVKDRILEYLAVMKLAGPGHRGPILCFVGPPGVGKTSLGQTIAEVLQRPLVRLSLGGVHDEADIRGHRRTYVNALPGRIIKAMCDAKITNPVVLLDEIDKIGRDRRGDPSAALLEVLDPEQNRAFIDHYIDLPYDLSQVVFITTANSLEDVDEALIDRLEIIELNGYTEDEKVEIARLFLVPKQREANGLPAGTISIPPNTIRQMIRLYNFEAGVRGLERNIAAVSRKIARRIAEDRSHPKRILPAMLTDFLGPPRYDPGMRLDNDEVGVATGMVWTERGGDILAVEVGIVDGKGGLTMTGQLGEVMQESVQTALSFTRVHARRLGIDPAGFDKLDIHLHLPEGGVPKDGPSAGITVVAGLVSALTGRALKCTVAMTGELTLLGRILPVGGIKEKVLGAYRAGITEIILPTRNQREVLAELPANIRSAITFHPVSKMDEVFPLAFVENPLAHPWQPRQRAPKAAGKPKASKAPKASKTVAEIVA